MQSWLGKPGPISTRADDVTVLQHGEIVTLEGARPTFIKGAAPLWSPEFSPSNFLKTCLDRLFRRRTSPLMAKPN